MTEKLIEILLEKINILEKEIEDLKTSLNVEETIRYDAECKNVELKKRIKELEGSDG